MTLQPRRGSSANNLAWILAAGSDENVRNGAEAVCWAEHCATLRGRDNVAVLDTLAAAYTEAGRFEEAVAAQATARLREQGPSPRLAELEQRLKTYQAGKPYRQ